MILYSILLLTSLMFPSTSGTKPTSVNDHKYTEDGIQGIEAITEIAWNNIKSMDIKVKLPVKAETSELPISIYNNVYKLYMAKRQHMTRIASMALLWTPTSAKFQEMATLIVVDERFKNDFIRTGKKEMLETGQLNTNILGNIITAVPFDPNFQQFITGSLDFATDTMDINKVKFYISFPDTRMAQTGSTAGYMDLSWKTMPDENGVYEKVQWDVFTFEKRLPAEIELMSGKNNFLKIKSYLNKKYNERMDELRQLNNFSHALVYGSDQGLCKARNSLNEDRNESTQMLVDSKRRLEAIRLRNINVDISDAKGNLQKALSGDDESEIEAAQAALVAVFKKHDLDVPEEFGGEVGYVTIGEAQ
nr:movement protein [Aspen mosaic-associated virus]WLF82607.1 movement protein [Aspen mosaic-associated virus]WLF82608.1 movement protein [Aspen mosaic-associated virus]WLF82637.1 movement protein [Aspen mosaic-associated virus]